MTATLLALYFKLNILFAVVLLVWLLLRQLARAAGLEPGYARQLSIGRYLFLGMLGAAPLLMLGSLLLPGWVAGFAASTPGTWLAGEMTIVSGIAAGLDRQLAVGGFSVSLASLALALLMSGFALYLVWLIRQVSRLRHIICGAVEWKSIGHIHLLFSPQVGAPFSTRALGRKHVVLPWQLMESPRNLQLAIKHELQHMRNGDLEWVILMEGIKALCFWNPAVWLWHNEFDCLQEFACDEVLVNDRRVSSQAYGNCLLDVAAASHGRALPASSNMVPKFALFINHRTQLKRRITMLANTRTTRHAALKSLGYGLVLGLSLTGSSLWVFAADADNAPPAPTDRGEYLSTVTVPPEYPQSALDAKLEGWVQIEFTVDEAGAVADPVVQDNCAGASLETCTSGNDIFDANSLAAIRQFQFEPRTEEGIAVATPGVQYVFRFHLDEEE